MTAASTVAATSPLELNFVGDEIEIASNGVIYFLHNKMNRVHRWDITKQTFLSDLVGTANTNTMSVAPDGTVVYLAYSGGRIDIFDVSNNTRRFFAAAPAEINALVVVDSYLFCIDNSGAWSTHSLYSRATGMRVASDDWRHTGRSFAWAPRMGRLFFLRSSGSPTDIHYVDIDTVAGTLGPEKDSPYHGDFSLPSPIRVLLDESRVIVGSGLLFNTVDLKYIASFGLNFMEIVSYGGHYFLVNKAAATTEMNILDSGFNILGTRSLDGAPHAAFVRGHDLVLVTDGSSSGSTRVHVLPLAGIVANTTKTTSNECLKCVVDACKGAKH